MSTRAIPNSPTDYNERGESPATQSVFGGWVPIDLGPILRNESIGPKPSVLFRDDGVAFFYPSCLNSLNGESEAGKTFVAAVAVVQEVDRGNSVIFIDFEGSPKNIVARLKDLGLSEQQIREQFFYSQPEVMFNELQQDEVATFIAEHGAPSLVILDGVTEVMAQANLNPDVGVDVAKFYAGAPRWFARLGAAVVLIDHVTKNKESRNGHAIGSERKKSGIDGAAYMVDLMTPFGRGKTGKVKLVVMKDRGGYIREHTGNGNVIAFVEFRSSPDDGSITTTITAPQASQSVPFVPTFIMEQISKAIEAEPGIGLNALRKAVGGNKGIQDLALEILITRGFLEVKTGSNRIRQHTSLRQYRERDESVNQGGDDDHF